MVWTKNALVVGQGLLMYIEVDPVARPFTGFGEIVACAEGVGVVWTQNPFAVRQGTLEKP